MYVPSACRLRSLIATIRRSATLAPSSRSNAFVSASGLLTHGVSEPSDRSTNLVKRLMTESGEECTAEARLVFFKSQPSADPSRDTAYFMNSGEDAWASHRGVRIH